MVLAERIINDPNTAQKADVIEVDLSLPTTAELLVEMKAGAEERGFSASTILGATLSVSEEFEFSADTLSVRQTVERVKKKLATEFGFDWRCMWEATFEHFVLVAAGRFEHCYLVQTTPTRESDQLHVYLASIPSEKLRTRN